MRHRPFRLLSGSALAAAQGALAAGVSAWAAQWGLAAGAWSLACRRHEAGGEAGAPAWNRAWRAGEAQMWLALPAALQLELQRTLFAPDGGHAPYTHGRARLAEEGAARALEQLLAALAGAALPGGVRTEPVGMPGLDELGRGAGTVALALRIGREQLQVLLDARCSAALAASPAAPPPNLPKLDYLKVLGETALGLPVEIGTTRIGLGTLMSVGIGDVIRLDASVDAPAVLRAPGGKPLFHAYLGRSGDVAAVEIANRYK